MFHVEHREDAGQGEEPMLTRTLNHLPPERDVWLVSLHGGQYPIVCESLEAARHWLSRNEHETWRHWQVIWRDEDVVQLRRWLGGSTAGEVVIARAPVVKAGW